MNSLNRPNQSINFKSYTYSARLLVFQPIRRRCSSIQDPADQLQRLIIGELCGWQVSPASEAVRQSFENVNLCIRPRDVLAKYLRTGRRKLFDRGIEYSPNRLQFRGKHQAVVSQGIHPSNQEASPRPSLQLRLRHETGIHPRISRIGSSH